MSTESELQNWRHGQINAERLCAGILVIEGYEAVDPQAPLGGPDDKKDILARRDGKQWAAGVFFPPTPQAAGAIRSKFDQDVQGVKSSDADGFVFFVNQHLTLGDRKKLADSQSLPVEIYWLERIRNALDSPKGYGLRLEHLRIPMSIEDQTAFFSELHQDFVGKIDRKLDLLLERTTSLTEALTTEPSSLNVPADVVGAFEAPMSDLNIATLSLIHRITTEDSASPSGTRGQLRAIQVFVGDPNDPSFVPPPPEAVPELLVDLLRTWRTTYQSLTEANRDSIVSALADFHHRFVSIHPFLDGNGRVARVLTDQAASELLGVRVSSELVSDPTEYLAGLREADLGDPSRLKQLIRAALI